MAATLTSTPSTIYSSPYPDLELFPGAVYEQIFEGLTAEEAGLTAVTELTTGATITYGELQRRADAVAGYLAERGIGPGSVVSLQIPNSINFAVALFGIFRAGATVNPIGVLMNTGDVEKISGMAVALAKHPAVDPAAFAANKLMFSGAAPLDEGIARVDEGGYFYIVDRAKEVIKYKGYQVAPAELEALLLTHDAIADAGVVGVERYGLEIPRAFVVLRQGAELTADELMAWVADRATPYKKVRAVIFLNEIPKNPTGKILRKDLRLIPLEA